MDLLTNLVPRDLNGRKKKKSLTSQDTQCKTDGMAQVQPENPYFRNIPFFSIPQKKVQIVVP